MDNQNNEYNEGVEKSDHKSKRKANRKKYRMFRAFLHEYFTDLDYAFTSNWFGSTIVQIAIGCLFLAAILIFLRPVWWIYVAVFLLGNIALFSLFRTIDKKYFSPKLSVTSDSTTGVGDQPEISSGSVRKQGNSFRPKLVFRSTKVWVNAGGNRQEITLDKDGNARQDFRVVAIYAPIELSFRANRRIIRVLGTITDGTNVVNMTDLPDGSIGMDFQPGGWKIFQDEDALEVVAGTVPIFQVVYNSDVDISVNGAFPPIFKDGTPIRGEEYPVTLLSASGILLSSLGEVRQKGTGITPIFDPLSGKRISPSIIKPSSVPSSAAPPATQAGRTTTPQASNSQQLQFSVMATKSFDAAFAFAGNAGQIWNGLSPICLVKEVGPHPLFERCGWPITSLSYIYLVNTSADVPFTVFRLSIEALYANGKTVLAEFPSGRVGYLTLSMFRDKYEAQKKIGVGNSVLQPTIRNSRNAITVKIGLAPSVFNSAISGRKIAPGETVQGWIFYALPDGLSPVKYRMKIVDTLGRTQESEIGFMSKIYDGTQVYPNDPYIVLGDEVDMRRAMVANEPIPGMPMP